MPWEQTAKEARDFLAQLQAAVRSNDKDRIAGMIGHPLLALHSGRRTRIRRKQAFLASYDRIFTAAVRHAILRQSAECLFGNDQGAMIGDGEVWFREQTDGAMKIVTVNDSAPRP